MSHFIRVCDRWQTSSQMSATVTDSHSLQPTNVEESCENLFPEPTYVRLKCCIPTNGFRSGCVVEMAFDKTSRLKVADLNVNESQNSSSHSSMWNNK